MSFRFSTFKRAVCVPHLFWLFCLAVAGNLHGAGVTLVTHGLNSDVTGWIIPMADKMPQSPHFQGTNFTCYEMRFITNAQGKVVIAQTKLGGVNPTNSDSGEIFIKLNWSQFSDGYSSNTTQIATAVVPALLQTNFIPELGGKPLVELPLHLVGHSRGGSLVCEITRLLGAQGVWVDQLTTLDPHPLNNDGFNDFFFSVVDASALAYVNVLFADNYYQSISSPIKGEAIAGAYNRRLTSLSGGYAQSTPVGYQHSNVHLWYHGTIDTNTPASDNQASITTTERQAWWAPSENQGGVTGFYYTLIGGGNRLGTNEPAGAGTGQIRAGYNGVWNLGGGLGSRRSLPSNNGTWPNLLRLNILGTAQVHLGETNTFRVYWQSGQDSSNADLRLYLDTDANPYNANQTQITQLSLPGTGTNAVSTIDVSAALNPVTTLPGTYSVYARISDGLHTRYLYAPEPLILNPSLQPPRLTPLTATTNPFQLSISGFPGQKLIIQSSTNCLNWTSLITNTLAGTNGTFLDAAASSYSRRFYRALLSP
ncbi:MAG: hypothetical protein JWR69_3896 [Pedosphaera sp.]|nr:hypothetical protein [Pedosphaera sp.]